MKHSDMVGLLVFLLMILIGTAVVQAQVQVVLPQGIESVDGSNINMGCTSPLVDSDGVMICDSCSYMIDGDTPVIDTSTSDWAAQLVTVRKTRTDEISFDHVLLTFGFDTAVTLTGIELDLFLCPDMNINAPFITLFADEESNLVFTQDSFTSLSFQSYPPGGTVLPTSCDSLSTITITLSDILTDPYITWHILISSFTSSIDWVYVGDVRFVGMAQLQMTCITPPMISQTPSMTSTGIPITPSLKSSLETSLKTSFSSFKKSHSPQVTNSALVPSMTVTTPMSSSTSSYISTSSTTTSTTVVVSSTMPTSIYIASNTPSTSTGSENMPTLSTSTDSENTPTLSTSTGSENMPTLSTSTGSENRNLVLVLGIAIIGLTILVLILVGVVIIICCLRKGCCSNKTKTMSYELGKLSTSQSDRENHSFSALNPITSIDNSRYARTDPSVGDTDSGDGSYDVVRQEMFTSPVHQPLLAATEQSSTVVDTGLYDIISIPTATTTQAIEASELTPKQQQDLPNGVQPETIDSSSEYANLQIKKSCTIPSSNGDNGYDVIRHERIASPDLEAFYEEIAVKHPSTLINEVTSLPATTTHELHSAPQHQQDTPNDAHPDQTDTNEFSDRMYSVVQVRKGPKIPEKSSELLKYLETRTEFDENIYSESISPSDFTSSNQPTEIEDIPKDPIIYAPIYPPSSVLPEAVEPPAEVTIDNIIEKRPLRMGQFGEVVLAATNGLSLKNLRLSKREDGHDVSITVAVKKLKSDPTQIQKESFETEAKFLSKLRHPNVVRLLGVCYNEPAFIMMEYMREGDLSQFLQKYSEVVSMTTPSNETRITWSTLVYIASQIASGMKKLAEFNFIHRDLATRNFLIGRNFTVKVANLGVNKNIYLSHYFQVQGNTLLPIRWMASECFNGKFSEKSDVWAFGVTIWELFTLAKKVPYPHLSDEEVIHNALKREHRQFPSQPTGCPDDVYEIMEQCWKIDMKQRATFKSLHTMLQTFS